MKYYQVPMFAELRELLERKRRVAKSEYVFLNSKGDPLTAYHASRVAGRLIKKLGFKGLTLHGLRHTMVTKASNSQGVHVASKLAGHSNLATTQQYVHVNAEEGRKALENIVPLKLRGH